MTPEPPPSGAAAPPSKLILIVEDDEAARSLLEFAIRRDGFEAHKAGDGQEALQLIERRRPDLILLDLMLPKYGGFELLRHLQEGDFKNIPIIVISGRVTDSATVDVIRKESNVVEFISKPIPLPYLLDTVHRTLKTSPP